MILDAMKHDGNTAKLSPCSIEGNDMAKTLCEQFGSVIIDRDEDDFVRCDLQ